MIITDYRSVIFHIALTEKCDVSNRQLYLVILLTEFLSDHGVH